MNHDIITMDHGSGGGATSRLIEELLIPAFHNPQLSALGDGALLDLTGPLVFSTDSFVIDPVFFPGGDIGKLAVCGTVNDVAMCGGTPKYLSLTGPQPLSSLRRAGNRASRPGHRALARSSLLRDWFPCAGAVQPRYSQPGLC